jgi:hypothetical protein
MWPAMGMKDNKWDWPAGLLVLSYLAIIVLTFRDYGVTWDEEVQSNYGEQVIRWYSTHFADRSALTYRDLKYYGGFFDAVAQSATRVSPFGVLETRHLANALFGVAGVIGTYKLGKYLAGPPSGFLAALFLILTPVYYGHSFNNPKDIPFAALTVFAMVYLVRSVRHFPRVPVGLTARLGLALGFTLAIRVGGAVLVGYMGIAACLWLVSRYGSGRRRNAYQTRIPTPVARLALWFLGTCAIAYAVMLVWWPYAQVDPIRNPLRALRVEAQFPHIIPMLFEGKTIAYPDIPWYYVGKWFLITIPEFFLIALVVAASLAGAAIYRAARKRGGGKQFIEYALLLISIVLPVVFAAATHANVYDGLRHFLFILPPLAVLAAAAIVKLVGQPRTRVISVAVSAAVLLSMVLTIVDMARLHPYETIFFNRLFGRGVAEAARAFETDYWGNSYKEGVEWIVENYQAPAGMGRVKVASCSSPLSTEYYLPVDRFEYVGSYDFEVSDRPDLFLATTRWDCDKNLDGRIVHIVTRMGAPILYVKEIDRPES